MSRTYCNVTFLCTYRSRNKFRTWTVKSIDRLTWQWLGMSIWQGRFKQEQGEAMFYGVTSQGEVRAIQTFSAGMKSFE
jgi:hypothetical protein